MSTRTACDWSGHRDSEYTYQPEVCTRTVSIYGDVSDWKLGDSEDANDYCPEHAKYICGECGEPNMQTEACPNAGDICLDCCEEDH